MKDRTYFTLTGFSYLFLMAAALAAQFAATLIIRRAAPQILSNVWMLWLLGSVPIYVVGGPVCAALMRRLEKKSLYKTEVSPVWWLRCLLCAFFLMDAGSLIGTGVNALLQKIAGFQVTAGITDAIAQSSIFQIVLFAVILAPVAEELIFRKLVIDRLIVFGDRAAILISALLFGAMHGNLTQFFYAFFVGLLFGYVYIRTGRLRYTIGLHMTLNFFGSVIPMLLQRQMGPSYGIGSGTVLSLQSLQLVVYSMLVLMLFVAGLVIFLQGIRQLQLRPGERTKAPGVLVKQFFTSPGIICWLIFSVALFVYNAWA